MKLPWQIWTILGLSILVLILTFFPNRCNEPTEIIAGDLTTEQENELRASLVTAEGRGDSLQRELDKSKANSIVSQEAFKREIKAKAKTIAELKANPAIITIVEANPVLESLHRSYDSALTAYDKRVTDLTDELQLRDKINLQLKTNLEQRLTQTEQLLHEKEVENLELQKQNKKLKRGRVLRNIVLPAAVVGAFILGIVAD